jgi:hypothetical protein
MLNRLVIAVALVASCAAVSTPVAAEGLRDWARVPDSATAATPDEPPAPDHFGLDDQYTTFGIGSFTPQTSSMTYGYKGSGYIYPTAVGGLEWLADLGPSSGVPVGAVVIQVCVYVFDDSSNLQATLSVGAYEFGSSSDDPAYENLGLEGSGLAATPGYTAVCISPSDLVIRSYTDFAGDSTDFYGYYRAGVSLDGDTSDVAFGGMLVRWRRQISPAPGIATFGDVSTNHLFFQHVEALVDSGITAGCGGGNFCPDSPVTRGQMAVFLAKALGLYWPF